MFTEKVPEYSDAEWKLIDFFGYRNFAINSKISPPMLYRELAVLAVKKGMVGPAVQAVGRAMDAMDSGRCYRMTEEFDRLISFDDGKSNEELLKEALEELVSLKLLKNRYGKTPEYLERQPKAWIAAENVLEDCEKNKRDQGNSEGCVPKKPVIREG